MFLENTVNAKEQFGWIEVICGSMFSGETEELIRRLKRAQFAKQRVEIFKPDIDVRYGGNRVVSHDSNEILSTPVPSASNIPLLADGCDVVGIDEAQFFDDEIVSVCNTLANKGVRVIVAGQVFLSILLRQQNHCHTQKLLQPLKTRFWGVLSTSKKDNFF